MSAVTALAAPVFPADEDITMAELEARTERLDLVIITDGRSFQYAQPGAQLEQGWRLFRFVDRTRQPTATGLRGEAPHANHSDPGQR